MSFQLRDGGKYPQKENRISRKLRKGKASELNGMSLWLGEHQLLCWCLTALDVVF